MNILNKIIKEELNNVINENRIATFNNITFPNFGWCVILAGGPGSGKGHALGSLISINGKVINVDIFKKLYVKMHNNLINGEIYNSTNPIQVSQVHDEVKNKDYKNKYTKNLFNTNAHNKQRLPNIIFDMTAKNPNDDVVDISLKAKEIGYKVSLIWIVSNRNEAILRNLQRSRRVKDSILHRIHNALALNMPSFLKSKRAVNCLDESWIIFCSTNGIRRSDLNNEESKDAAIKLTKNENGFSIDNKYIKRLYDYLGKNEENPDNPTTYLTSDEIANKFGKKNHSDKGILKGYTFDRSQFNDKSNFYR